jgi:hypothetical protein
MEAARWSVGQAESQHEACDDGVADLHRQAAKQRLLRQLRASRRATVQRRRNWERLTFRRPQPAS